MFLQTTLDFPALKHCFIDIVLKVHCSTTKKKIFKKY